MPTSTRRSATLFALVLFSLVMLLRIGVAESWNLGRQDVERFEELPYGFDLAPNTPPFFLTWSRGDGQAFMSIAADLNGDGVSSGLGNQSYRMSRIAHSALARVLAIGNVESLPYGLAAASFGAYAALLAVSIRLADVLGRRALLLGLSPAAMIGTVFDTAEGLGSLLLTVGMTTSSVWLGVLAGGLLGTARPTYGTAILASRSGPLVPLATLTAGALLQVFLVFGLSIPFSGGSGNIVFPFSGYLDALPTMHPAVMASAAVVLTMAAVLVGYSFNKSYLGRFRLAAAASAALAISVGPSTFVGPMSPLRVSGALVVLLLVAPLFRAESKNSFVPTSSANTQTRGAVG